MKKCISLIFVLAMMLSLAVAGTVGTSAATASDYYGCYATTEPTIDGEIDEIWSTTVPMYVTTQSYGYVKLLWREDAVYLLADLNGCTQVDFLVSTRFYNTPEAKWDWGGNYGLTCKADTDSSSENYTASATYFIKNAKKIATGATAKAKSNNSNGFVVEVKIPFRDLTNESKRVDSFIGFGAYVNNDWNQAKCVGIDTTTIAPTTESESGMGLAFGSYTLYDMRLHSAPVYKQTVPATCTEPAIKDYNCSTCNKVLQSIPVENPELDPNKHSGKEVFVDNEDGTHSKKWNCCGAVVSTEGHTYGASVTDKLPTCTEDGTGSEFCMVCNSKHVLENIPALGHDLDKSEMIIDKEPTCTEKGSKSYHCKREGCDGKGEVTEIDALGHDFDTTLITDKEPTCTEKGSKSYHCKREGCDGKDSVIENDALGHIPGDWKTLTVATCSKKGEEYCTCTRCWETIEIREIAMLAHNATEWIIDKEAAPGVEGKRHQKCTVCGTLFNEEVIEALPEENTSNLASALGCGSSIAGSAWTVCATVALAVGAVWNRKKKED